MNHSHSSTKEPNAGNFVSMLQFKSGGVSLAELDCELADLIKAVVAQGGAPAR